MSNRSHHSRHADLKNPANKQSMHQPQQHHHHHHHRLQQNRKLSLMRSVLICCVASLTCFTLWISLTVVSNSNNFDLSEQEQLVSVLDPRVVRSSRSQNSGGGGGSTSYTLADNDKISNNNNHGKDNDNDDHDNDNHDEHLRRRATHNYQEIRKRAIEEASKLTKSYIHMEEKLQEIIEREREDYLEKIAKEQQAKKEKEEELQREHMEAKYYMYYEDSNDSESTVIGITFSQDARIYKRFVGSLRNIGFGGKIILGVEDVSLEIRQYLEYHNVTLKELEPVECTFINAKKRQKCYKPYPHIKREWAHFPLARDWLSGCVTCSGPVVFTSVDRTFFQLNPFGSGMPVVKRLHLYEQHPAVDASKTSAGVLLKACVDIDLEKELGAEYPDIEPRGLLSAATALGTRDDIIDYLGLVYSSIREWMQKTECHFQHSSSDSGMAIVNFLRVRNRLPYRTRLMVHRTGIVNNVEFEGQNALEAHVHLWKFRGLTEEEANFVPYEGANGNVWIDTDYMVTNEYGLFIDVFFETSAIIYGYDSFGLPFLNWLDRKLNITSSEDAVVGVAADEIEKSGKTGLLSPNISDDTLDAVKKNVIRVGVNEQQKDKEGYYLDHTTQEELAKNSSSVERKTDLKLGETKPILDEKVASQQDSMYYPVEPTNATVEEQAEQKVVPVDESHEKGSENKVEEEVNEDKEDEKAEKDVANVERIPVDTKFEVLSHT